MARMQDNHLRKRLGAEGRLLYAIIDFDLALIVPPNADGSNGRLPVKEFYIGSPICPDDVAEGQLDYDPFVTDVGLLGMTLKYHLNVGIFCLTTFREYH